MTPRFMNALRNSMDEVDAQSLEGIATTDTRTQTSKFPFRFASKLIADGKRRVMERTKNSIKPGRMLQL